MLKVEKTDIEGLVILSPQVHEDSRGSFVELFSAREFAEKVAPVEFVQDNESHSVRGVVRGLHYQRQPMAQAKLVRVVSGRVLDVAVDIRKSSPTFGKHVVVELSSENGRQLFLPRGFAHGFVVLSEEAVVQYKCDNYYSPENECMIAFDDPELGIGWPLELVGEFVLSDKDKAGESFAEVIAYE